MTGGKLDNWDVISSSGGICSFPLPGWLCNPSTLLSIVFSGSLSGGEVSRQHATIKFQGLVIKDTNPLIVM